MATASNIEPMLERLRSVSSRDDLRAAIPALRDMLGVAHVVYHSVNATGGQTAELTYSPGWVDRYLSEDFARIDPVVLGCYRRFGPVDWKSLDWKPRPARAFLHEAIESGVGNQGWTLPIRGPSGQFSLFSVNDRASDAEWSRFTQAHGRQLILTAHYLNQKVLDLTPGGEVALGQRLSPREVDALTLLATGLSRAQAADRLAISEHTLRAYLENARHKLGATNTVHAVARAMSSNLLVV